MLIEKTKMVKNALLTVPVDVFHYYAKNKPDQYVVWAETGEEESVNADDHKYIQTIVGMVTYFTKSENDENADRIQDALKENGISFFLDDVRYDENTGYIQYVWEFKVM